MAGETWALQNFDFCCTVVVPAMQGLPFCIKDVFIADRPESSDRHVLNVRPGWSPTLALPELSMLNYVFNREFQAIKILYPQRILHKRVFCINTFYTNLRMSMLLLVLLVAWKSSLSAQVLRLRRNFFVESDSTASSRPSCSQWQWWPAGKGLVGKRRFVGGRVQLLVDSGNPVLLGFPLVHILEPGKKVIGCNAM